MKPIDILLQRVRQALPATGWEACECLATDLRHGTNRSAALVRQNPVPHMPKGIVDLEQRLEAKYAMRAQRRETVLAMTLQLRATGLHVLQDGTQIFVFLD